MTRYFFDIDDGEKLLTDDTGVEFDTLAEAKAGAVCALPAIALDVVDGVDRVCAVTLRTETGEVLMRATLTLTVEHLG